MTDRKIRKVEFRVVLGILLSLAAMAVLFLIIDEKQVLIELKQVRLVVIIIVLALVTVSLLTRAAAWRIILHKRISLWRSFTVINSGYFVNTVLPFRLGELARAFLLLPSGISFWEALPTIVLERLFDIGFVVILFFITLPYTLNFHQGIAYAYIMAALVLVGLTSLYFLVRYQDRIISWIDQISSSGSKLIPRIKNLVKSVLSSLVILTDPLQVGKVFLWMLISWSIALATQYLLLRALIPDAKLLWAAFALGAVGLGVSIPSSPGNIGLYEASITLALSAFGVDHSTAFTFALLSHLLSLAITTPLGSFGLVREGYALRDVWQFRNQKENLI